MHTTGSRPKLVVSADGRGVVTHAGSRLLADLVDATGLTGSFANALHRYGCAAPATIPAGSRSTWR